MFGYWTGFVQWGVSCQRILAPKTLDVAQAGSQ
jgi:hypothetical protein